MRLLMVATMFRSPRQLAWGFFTSLFATGVVMSFCFQADGRSTLDHHPTVWTFVSLVLLVSWLRYGMAILCYRDFDHETGIFTPTDADRVPFHDLLDSLAGHLCGVQTAPVAVEATPAPQEPVIDYREPFTSEDHGLFVVRDYRRVNLDDVD